MMEYRISLDYASSISIQHDEPNSHLLSQFFCESMYQASWDSHKRLSPAIRPEANCIKGWFHGDILTDDQSGFILHIIKPIETSCWWNTAGIAKAPWHHLFVIVHLFGVWVSVAGLHSLIFCKFPLMRWWHSCIAAFFLFPLMPLWRKFQDLDPVTSKGTVVCFQVGIMCCWWLFPWNHCVLVGRGCRFGKCCQKSLGIYPLGILYICHTVVVTHCWWRDVTALNPDFQWYSHCKCACVGVRTVWWCEHVRVLFKQYSINSETLSNEVTTFRLCLLKI